ncbi:hypothetical protein SAMN04489729_4814 [Amycolatopsis lurida]|uniref:Uncharacterized protein n=1 Tax=Amycolatopsis lurida NRRL 2430 TaxID=1460371 RepID=A0A2P2FW90_AMYLU|nr:hypothetical protein [Amycolatopsis lurida]KFU81011.1 hypothetical protein BB31_11560 [Amycolatopsis lurida NRRL 2430]SED60478.1 hypothetical protein SAMN04489729_4814 [Amycolatopsis lurida]
MAPQKYLRATTGFLLPDHTIVKKGQTVAADDRVVKGREELFAPLEDTVEMLTRAPGEQRLNAQRPDTVVMAAAPPSRRARRAARKAADKAETTPAENRQGTGTPPAVDEHGDGAGNAEDQGDGAAAVEDQAAADGTATAD